MQGLSKEAINKMCDIWDQGVGKPRTISAIHFSDGNDVIIAKGPGEKHELIPISPKYNWRTGEVE